jgi:glycosyltransferase involved in cell wall biosynthesis
MVDKMKEDGVDIVNLNYFYHFDPTGVCDTQHRKTRIIKNDGCVSWAALYVHEDFKKERELQSFYSTDAAIYHMTDNDHTHQSMLRNVELAELAAKDFPDDPRAYWNLGNAYGMVGRMAESIPVYLTFITLSQSDDEKYLAWHRLAMAYKAMGDYERAIATEEEALTLRPWFPDAYFGMGEMMAEIGRFRHAKEFMDMGFKKTPPEDEMIVWNPREYDYNPHMLMARIFVQTSRPREAIKELKHCLKIYPKSDKIKATINRLRPEADKFDVVEKIFEKAKKLTDKDKIAELLKTVPEDMRYHPAILNIRNVHFTKETSSGKDVVIYCGYTDLEWSPEVFADKGVGGSEEAVIQLAKRWQKMGYNVTVYANTPRHQEYEFDGVKWKPFMAWNYRDKQDVTILWRQPKSLDYKINSTKVYIDMHDVIPKNEFTPSRLNDTSLVVFKSESHRKYCDNVPNNKSIVIPHGLDLVQFDARRSAIERNPYKIINTSSPDRGLLTCFNIVKRVHEKLPDDLKPLLKFRWNYGFRVWDQIFSSDESMMQWKQYAIQQMEELKHLGIVEDGSGDMISQNAIVDQYLESGLLLYPSNFFEIGFISGIKAALAGAIPVTTDVFAQGEFLKDGIIVHSDANYENWQRNVKEGTDFGVQEPEKVDEFVDKIVEYMKNPEKYEEQRNKIIEHARSTFDWDKTAEAWAKLF